MLKRRAFYFTPQRRGVAEKWKNEELNKLGSIILDSSIEVHKQLGPGLLESVYELSLYKELAQRKIIVQRPVPIPVYYKGEDLNTEFKVDLLVENEVIIELKAVEILLPVHKAQILTY